VFFVWSGSLTAGSGDPASSFWLRHSLPNQPVHLKAEFRFCYILDVAGPPPVMCIVMRLRDPTMKIHGLRIYRNDLLGIFRPVAAAWRGHIFANDFGVNINADGTLEDPLPALGRQYGPALIAADVTRQLVLLRGDDFCRWGASLSCNEGALLPIFRALLLSIGDGCYGQTSTVNIKIRRRLTSANKRPI
jgi:hypothetical protein